jgi:metal-sulfur cluster biosynthetic enzyme
MLNKSELLKALEPVVDPEIGLSVVDLGLIYDIDISDDGRVNVNMTLTTPACPYGPVLVDGVKSALEEIDGVKDVTVEVVWDPPWDPAEMASDVAKDVLGIW